jgi:hypothetical protein
MAFTKHDEAAVGAPVDPLGPPPALPRVDLLPDIIGDSGGRLFAARVEAGARSAVESLLRELGSQYLLGYAATTPPDGKYRRLKVEAVDKRLAVRHRAGYLAMPVNP